jgi:hypothetical protein
MTFQEINDTTGFANGEKFESPDEVRGYFTRQNLRDMVGGFYNDENPIPTQETLDAMAETVIENRWHMTEAAA